MGAEYLPDYVVLFSSERMDKRRAFSAVGNIQKHPVCHSRGADGCFMVSICKAGYDVQVDVARSNSELPVLHTGCTLCAVDSAYRNAYASENLYVHLDDRDVQESQ